MESKNFVPLKVADIAIGKPLPWPVYDGNRSLLLREGFVIENQRQVETLIEKGLYRNTRWKKTSISSKPEKDNKETQAPTENTQAQFEEMSPKVGDPFQIQTTTSFGEERHSVKLLGFLPGKTVMVGAPMVDGHLILMRESQNVIVRSFSGTAAHGFSTSIIKVCNSPISYLHLAYPKFVHKVSVRESARVAFNIIGTVVNLKNGEKSPSTPVSVVDVSTSGAAFVSTKKIAEKEDALRLTFRAKVKDIEVYPILPCIVRSIAIETGENDNHKYRYGIQFLELPTHEMLVLQSMVYQKMLEKV